MFRPNSGRPGMPFTYSLPGTTPSAPPSKPLVFRAPVSTYHPVDYLSAPKVNECKLKSEQIVLGAMGGAIASAPTGIGILPGIAGGALTGAVYASHEQRQCKLEEKKERARNYLKSRGQ